MKYRLTNWPIAESLAAALCRKRLWIVVTISVVVTTTIVIALDHRTNWRPGYVAGAEPLQSAIDIDAFGFTPRPLTAPQKLVKGIRVVDGQLSDLKDDELVIGVELNGQTRAYLINSMNGPSHEVLNDEIGGVPIAVTW